MKTKMKTVKNGIYMNSNETNKEKKKLHVHTHTHARILSKIEREKWIYGQAEEWWAMRGGTTTITTTTAAVKQAEKRERIVVKKNHHLIYSFRCWFHSPCCHVCVCLCVIGPAAIPRIVFILSCLDMHYDLILWFDSLPDSIAGQ